MARRGVTQAGRHQSPEASLDYWGMDDVHRRCHPIPPETFRHSVTQDKTKLKRLLFQAFILVYLAVASR